MQNFAKAILTSPLIMGLTFVGLALSRVNEFDGIICMQSCQNDAEHSIQYHQVLILWSCSGVLLE